MNDAIQTRRSDLDWLRIIAFGLLIYFHAAVVFLPSGIPMIQNDISSPVLQVFVVFLHQFRLALLFLISGVGVCFALKHRSSKAFAKERAERLLIPLAFGVLVLVPPMVYLEKQFLGTYQGPFSAFYGDFFVSGVYPDGHLSWHHLWFLAYLYLFCLISLPLLAHLKTRPGRARLRALTRWLDSGWRLYLAVVPLLLVEVPLRAAFPGFRDVIHDWASFSHWFLIFVAGYVFASSEGLLNRTEALRWPSVCLAALCTAILFAEFYDPAHGFSPFAGGPVDAGRYLWFCLVRVANVWFWLLTCLGFAGRYLRRSNRTLAYLNDAVYPLFCVHLPIIVALAYLIVPLGWPVWIKYSVITGATVCGSILAYESVRRIAWIRPLVGLKPL
jgi:glucans biosynthesis protein C